MPAAAVIPAPIAYIKVVAVKKLVVECQAWRVGICWCALSGVLLAASIFSQVFNSFWGTSVLLTGCVWGSRTFTLKKLECLKQACSLEYISME